MSKPTPPVKIKLYGFLPVTRRSYYVLLSLGVVLLVAFLLFWGHAGLAHEPPDALLLTRLWVWFWNSAPWIVLVGVLVELIEVWYVLRKFAAEEARRRAEGR